MFQEFIDKGNIPSDLEEILKDDIKQDLEKIVDKEIEGMKSRIILDIDFNGEKENDI